MFEMYSNYPWVLYLAPGFHSSPPPSCNRLSSLHYWEVWRVAQWYWCSFLRSDRPRSSGLSCRWFASPLRVHWRCWRSEQGHSQPLLGPCRPEILQMMNYALFIKACLLLSICSYSKTSLTRLVHAHLSMPSDSKLITQRVSLEQVVKCHNHRAHL